MLIDPESKILYRRKISELVANQIDGLVTGNFIDMAALERHRGVIVGLGMALDLLEDKPQSETLSEETSDEQSS